MATQTHYLDEQKQQKLIVHLDSKLNPEALDVGGEMLLLQPQEKEGNYLVWGIESRFGEFKIKRRKFPPALDIYLNDALIPSSSRHPRKQLKGLAIFILIWYGLKAIRMIPQLSFESWEEEVLLEWLTFGIIAVVIGMTYFITRAKLWSLIVVGLIHAVETTFFAYLILFEDYGSSVTLIINTILFIAIVRAWGSMKEWQRIYGEKADLPDVLDN